MEFIQCFPSFLVKYKAILPTLKKILRSSELCYLQLWISVQQEVILLKRSQKKDFEVAEI